MEELLLKMELERDSYRRKIYKVPIKVINYYIDYWDRHILEDPRKLLYSYDNETGRYVAIDNTTNDCWVEDFKSEEDAIKWLEEVA